MIGGLQLLNGGLRTITGGLVLFTGGLHIITGGLQLLCAFLMKFFHLCPQGATVLICIHMQCNLPASLITRWSLYRVASINSAFV